MNEEEEMKKIYMNRKYLIILRKENVNDVMYISSMSSSNGGK